MAEAFFSLSRRNKPLPVRDHVNCEVQHMAAAMKVEGKSSPSKGERSHIICMGPVLSNTSVFIVFVGAPLGATMYLGAHRKFQVSSRFILKVYLFEVS